MMGAIASHGDDDEARCLSSWQGKVKEARRRGRGRKCFIREIHICLTARPPRHSPEFLESKAKAESLKRGNPPWDCSPGEGGTEGEDG